MRYLLLAAMLLSASAFADTNPCDVIRPFAKPGETLVNANNQCYALSQREFKDYMRRLTGSATPCAEARKQLDEGDVLAVLPSGTCIAMSRKEAEQKIARIQAR